MNNFDEILNKIIICLKERNTEELIELLKTLNNSVSEIYNILKLIEQKINCKVELLNESIILTAEINNIIYIILLKKGTAEDITEQLSKINCFEKYKLLGFMSSFSMMEALEQTEKIIMGIKVDENDLITTVLKTIE